MAGRLQLGMVPAMARSAVLLLFVALTAASLQSFPSPLAPHSGRACPALSGKGCSACVAAPTDGRCPGHWCDQPCVHTSQSVGKGRKGDCFPANWWATQKHTYPKVTCTGNGTGCRRVCGTPAPAPPAPPPCPHPGPVPPPDVATATYLTDYPNAVCLDGSPGYYYHRPAPAGVNATKWVFHIQGGGWCDDAASCAGRTKRYLGSSKPNVTGLPDSGAFTDILCPTHANGPLGPWCGGGAGVGSYVFMLNDPSVNEYTYDWHSVFLRYCDGMAFTGNASSPLLLDDGQKLWFRGYEILRATFDSLTRSKHRLGDATDVNLGGSSAGGHATYLHVDRMADWVYAANEAAGKPRASIVAMPDSGFWPESQRSAEFRGWFALQGNVTDGLPKNCKYATAGSDVSRCLFPEFFADEIETRLFPQQSLYDPDQHQTNKTPGFVNAHGKWLLATMNRTVLQTRRDDERPNGAWIHSCTRHCGSQLLNIDGYTATTALETLLDGGATVPKRALFMQDEPYPCKACCDDESYPPKRTSLVAFP